MSKMFLIHWMRFILGVSALCGGTAVAVSLTGSTVAAIPFWLLAFGWGFYHGATSPPIRGRRYY